MAAHPLDHSGRCFDFSGYHPSRGRTVFLRTAFGGFSFRSGIGGSSVHSNLLAAPPASSPGHPAKSWEAGSMRHRRFRGRHDS
jgi:hypothetical protein